MSLGLELQSPGSTRGYSIDWRDLFGEGVVNGSAWTISPQSGGVPSVSDAGYAAGIALCRVSGLTERGLYEVTSRVTLGGVIEERSFTLRGGAQ